MYDVTMEGRLSQHYQVVTGPTIAGYQVAVFLRGLSRVQVLIFALSYRSEVVNELQCHVHEYFSNHDDVPEPMCHTTSDGGVGVSRVSWLYYKEAYETVQYVEKVYVSEHRPRIPDTYKNTLRVVKLKDLHADIEYGPFSDRSEIILPMDWQQLKDLQLTEFQNYKQVQTALNTVVKLDTDSPWLPGPYQILPSVQYHQNCIPARIRIFLNSNLPFQFISPEGEWAMDNDPSAAFIRENRLGELVDNRSGIISEPGLTPLNRQSVLSTLRFWLPEQKMATVRSSHWERAWRKNDKDQRAEDWGNPKVQNPVGLGLVRDSDSENESQASAEERRSHWSRVSNTREFAATYLPKAKFYQSRKDSYQGQQFFKHLRYGGVPLRYYEDDPRLRSEIQEMQRRNRQNRPQYFPNRGMNMRQGRNNARGNGPYGPPLGHQPRQTDQCTRQVICDNTWSPPNNEWDKEKTDIAWDQKPTSSTWDENKQEAWDSGRRGHEERSKWHSPQGSQRASPQQQPQLTPRRGPPESGNPDRGNYRSRYLDQAVPRPLTPAEVRNAWLNRPNPGCKPGEEILEPIEPTLFRKLDGTIDQGAINEMRDARIAGNTHNVSKIQREVCFLFTICRLNGLKRPRWMTNRGERPEDTDPDPDLHQQPHPMNDKMRERRAAELEEHLQNNPSGNATSSMEGGGGTGQLNQGATMVDVNTNEEVHVSHNEDASRMEEGDVVMKDKENQSTPTVETASEPESGEWRKLDVSKTTSSLDELVAATVITPQDGASSSTSVRAGTPSRRIGTRSSPRVRNLTITSKETTVPTETIDISIDEPDITSGRIQVFQDYEARRSRNGDNKKN